MKIIYFLVQGACSFYCNVNYDAAGSITVLRRSNLSYVTRINTAVRNIKDITSLTVNSDGTKLLVTSKLVVVVILHVLLHLTFKQMVH